MTQFNNTKKKYYLLFTLLFLTFGVVVALVTSLINYKSNFSDIKENLAEWSKTESELKGRLLTDYINSSERMLASIVRSDLTSAYLKSGSEDDKKNIQRLFYTLAYSNKDIMQLRYLDTLGNEVIRIDRDKKTPELIVVPEDRLQNKKSRYYFKESALLMANQFWHSNIDLNMEHGKIEQPLKPTFRISTPLVIENQFKGIIIANLLFSDTIKLLTSSPNFLVYLADKDGEIIHSPDQNGSWSRYLDNRKSIYDIFPKLVHNILNKETLESQSVFYYNWGELFRNTEDINVIFAPKEEVIEGLKNKNLISAVLVAFTVLLVAIPLSWLASIIPSSLQKQLSTAFDDLKFKADLIDTNVMVSTTDKGGIIQDISSYFTQLTGYSRDEAIGKSHNILKHPDTPPEKHKQMWDTILNGNVWSGEILDRHKNGQDFWIKKVITPNLNSNGEIVSFTAIAHDITDKKIIEKMSTTDTLTGLFNRRRLEAISSAEIGRFNRYGSNFSVVLLDIDFFKLVNDSHGHQAGDDVLVQIARILKHNARKTDFVSRWGGEEFLIIASETDIDNAFGFAEKIRIRIQDFAFPAVGQVTVSCGVAQYNAEETFSNLMSRVDTALYEAKNTGRNKVIKG